MELARADADTIELYQAEVNTVWWEKCALIVGGTVCTLGAIGVTAASALDPALLAGSVSLLSTGITMFVKATGKEFPHAPNLAENHIFDDVKDSIHDLKLSGDHAEDGDTA